MGSLPEPLKFGDKAPVFEGLKGVDGKDYSLSTFDDKSILVFVFMANRCPTASRYLERLKSIQAEYGLRGVQLVGINSDDPYLFSSETLEEMTKVAKFRELNFPYLKDEDQRVGKAYGAWVTLHVFVFDRDRRLRYRGRVDDSRDPSAITQADLRNALYDLLAGREVRNPDTKPFACFIEYVRVPQQ